MDELTFKNAGLFIFLCGWSLLLGQKQATISRAEVKLVSKIVSEEFFFN